MDINYELYKVFYYVGKTLSFSEASKELFSDEMKEMERVEKQIQASIRSETGLRVDVTICEPESLPRSEGKAVRVIDERNLDGWEKW